VSDGGTAGMTVTCQQLVELVTEYLEGVLDAGTAAEIEGHLALCQGCEEYVAQIRQTVRMLSQMPVGSLSDSARADIMAAFREMTAPGDGPKGATR
jgi:anti-sigma factor RsiW